VADYLNGEVVGLQPSILWERSMYGPGSPLLACADIEDTIAVTPLVNIIIRYELRAIEGDSPELRREIEPCH
jgi:hypothetical protein